MAPQVLNPAFPYHVEFGDESSGNTTSTWVAGLPKLAVPAGSGEYFDGVVRYVKSWTTVFVQLPSASARLNEMQALLDADELNPLENAVKGSLGVVQFGVSAEFFRVLVLARKSPVLVNVLFVDYGNTEEIDRRIVFEMPQKLQVLPAQAIPIKIDLSAVGHRMRFGDFRQKIHEAEVSLLLGESTVKGRFGASIFLYDAEQQVISLEEAVGSSQSIRKSSGSKRLGRRKTSPKTTIWLPPITKNGSALTSTTPWTPPTEKLLADQPGGIVSTTESPVFTAHDAIWMGFAAFIAFVVIAASYVLLCVTTRCAKKMIASRRSAQASRGEGNSRTSSHPPEAPRSPVNTTHDAEGERAKAGKSFFTLQSIPNAISLMGPDLQVRDVRTATRSRILAPVPAFTDVNAVNATPRIVTSEAPESTQPSSIPRKTFSVISASSLNSEPAIFQYADSIHDSDYDLGSPFKEFSPKL